MILEGSYPIGPNPGPPNPGPPNPGPPNPNPPFGGSRRMFLPWPRKKKGCSGPTNSPPAWNGSRPAGRMSRNGSWMILGCCGPRNSGRCSLKSTGLRLKPDTVWLLSCLPLSSFLSSGASSFVVTCWMAVSRTVESTVWRLSSAVRMLLGILSYKQLMSSVSSVFKQPYRSGSSSAGR